MIWVDDILFLSGNVGLTHFLMKHLERSGDQKKKTHFVGLFFFTGLRAVLRLRRPPSQLDRPCAPPDVLLTTGSTLRLSTYRQLLRYAGMHAWDLESVDLVRQGGKVS